MADTIVSMSKSGSRVMSKILQRLARGSAQTTLADQKSNLNISRLKRRVWVINDADPAVAAASSAVAPVKMGDFVYRRGNDTAFICSVTVAPTTAASFIKLHA